ncbi:glycosyltransferase [bacterium]|nr:glycosyltransferase [bacterium]
MKGDYNRKKILIITASGFVLPRGCSLHLHSFISVLNQVGFSNITLLAPRYGIDDTFGKKVFIKRYGIKGFKKYPVGFSVAKLLNLPFFIMAAIFSFRRSYDYVIAHDHEGLFAGTILKLVFGKKFIYLSENPISSVLKSTNSNVIMLILADIFEKIFYRIISGLITNFSYELVDIGKYKRKHHLAMQLKISPDLSISDYHNQALNIPEKYIIYVGNFKSYQGLESLINAMRIIKNSEDEKVTLLIVGGDSDPARESNIRGLANDLPNVIFSGFLPLGKANYLIKNSYFGISLQQGYKPFSTKIYSYLLLGKPCVVTTSKVNKLELERYNIVRFAKEDPEDIARNILLLWKDRELHRKLRNSILDFSKEFRIDYIKNKLISLLDLF